MLKVCFSSILCVPCTTGLSTPLMVSKTIGKKRMQRPSAKGRSNG